MGESWVQCVTRVYHEKKKNNSDYKFKQAMKDAKSIYNKSKSIVSDVEEPKKKHKNTAIRGRRGTARRNRGTRRR